MMVSRENAHMETLLQCQNCGDLYTIRKQDKCYCEKCILFWEIEYDNPWMKFFKKIQNIFRG